MQVEIPGCRGSCLFPLTVESWQRFLLALVMPKAEAGTEFFGRLVGVSGSVRCSLLLRSAEDLVPS